MKIFEIGFEIVPKNGERCTTCRSMNADHCPDCYYHKQYLAQINAHDFENAVALLKKYYYLPSSSNEIQVEIVNIKLLNDELSDVPVVLNIQEDHYRLIEELDCER